MSTKPTPARGSDRLAAFRHTAVADVMHPGIVTCAPDTDLVTVARMMSTHHIHCVVVSGIERDEHGERLVWGLISDLDLVEARNALVYGEAGGFPRTRVMTVGPDESLERAADLMVEHRLSHLVVVDADTRRPVGIISSLDLIGALAWGREGGPVRRGAPQTAPPSNPAVDDARVDERRRMLDSVTGF